jgi:hypothetical protein
MRVQNLHGLALSGFSLAQYHERICRSWADRALVSNTDECAPDAGGRPRFRLQVAAEAGGCA